jgi:hypothetical protein
MIGIPIRLTPHRANDLEAGRQPPRVGPACWDAALAALRLCRPELVSFLRTHVSKMAAFPSRHSAEEVTAAPARQACHRAVILAARITKKGSAKEIRAR